MKFIIDLDGTILKNNFPNLDSVEFMAEIGKREMEFLIMTNSVCHPEIIVNRLHDVGITVSIESVLNPIVSINSYLKRQNTSKAFIIGSNEEVSQVCVKQEVDQPEIILLLDFEKSNIDYNALQKVFEFIQNGVPVISASGSTYYLKDGHKQIDTGSFVVLFESLLGDTIPIFGKPNEVYFNEALTLLNSEADKTLIIGDDWKTDILGGKKVGCKTALVKSGKYEDKDEKKGKPDCVVGELMEIFELINKNKF